MTKLKTSCPSCEKRLRIDEAKRGKTVRCPACGDSFTVSEAFIASEVTIDTAPAAVSVDTTELSNKETLNNVVGPAGQSREEQTLRKLGRFELKSVLGAGGFGKVYRAYDPQLERFVALKVPTFGPNQKTRIQRFLTEAKAAARLKHANIVTTFESGKADKKYYIASEYIEGDLLSDLTKKERPGVEDSVQIVRKLAEALAYAHGQGVVHRDIKPHNVMIDNNGAPQLMDFGLAKRTDDSSNLTTDGALLGTPAYMSPEQARGELHLVNPLSDQYSLGVVLYHLLTGGTPCEGSPHMVIAEVAKGEFHSVREWNARIDPTLDAVCQKAMHPEQGHRYTDCSQFATDLDAWAKRRPVIARPLTTLQKLGRTIVDHQLVVGLFSIILVLSFLAAVFAFKLSQQRVEVADVAEGVTTAPRIGDSEKPDSPPPVAETATEPSRPAVETTRTLTASAQPPVIEVANSDSAVSILSLIRPEDCLLEGSADANESSVTIDSSHGTTLIEIPVVPSSQYSLFFRAKRVSQSGSMVINLAYGESRVDLVLDGHGCSGFRYVDDVEWNKNSTRVRSTAFEGNSPRDFVIRVAKTSISVTVNGVAFCALDAPPSRVRSHDVTMPRNEIALAIQAWSQGVFQLDSFKISGMAETILPPNISSTFALKEIFQSATEVANYERLRNATNARMTSKTHADNSQMTSVSMAAGIATDADLAVLRNIGNLRELLFHNVDMGAVTAMPKPLSHQLSWLRIWSGNPTASFLDSFHTSSLQTLELLHCDLNESQVAEICEIESLRALRLDGCHLDGTSLAKIINALPNLSTLSMSDQRVAAGDVDLVVQALVTADNLRTVNIQHWNTIGDDSADKLAELTQLTSLDLNFTCLSDTGFQKIQDALPDTKFPSKFKSIPAPNPSAGASRFSQQELDALRQSHGNAIVDVLNIPMYRRGSRVEIVGDTDQPKTVRFSGGDDFSDGDLLAITKLQGPVEISARQTLTSTSNDPRLFHAIGRMPHLLKFSNWNNHGLGATHLEALSFSESLKDLSVPFQGMSEKEVAAVANITGLERLDLGGTDIDNVELELICDGLPNLKTLSLNSWNGGQAFGDSATEQLQKLKRLENLSVRDCQQLTDKCLQHLSKMTALKTLDISKTSITKQGAVLLRRAMPTVTLKSEGLMDSVEAVTTESLNISQRDEHPVSENRPPTGDVADLATGPEHAESTTTHATSSDSDGRTANETEVDTSAEDNATLVVTTSLRRDAVKDVQVELIDEQKNQIAKTRSDNRGRAVFRNLQPGNYEVICKSQITVSNAERKRRLGHLHRPTRDTLSVDNAGITQHRVSLLPLRSVKIEYAEVVPNADIVTYTSGSTRGGAVSEAVTSICHFPLIGRQNRTQSPIRIESSVDGAKLLLRCLPSGEVFDLGSVEFATAGGSVDDWRKLDGQQSRETIEGHTYLIQHNDGRRFKLRVSALD